MSTTKLTYFNGRGKGEIIRIILIYIGEEFSDIYLKEKEEIQKLRQDGFLLFQQVPLLEIDGIRITQTGATVRYLARRAGIYGNNNAESTRIDELFEGTRDFYSPFNQMGFRSVDELIVEIKQKTLPRYMPIFNKVLQETGSGYLVGSSVTLADLGLLELLLSVEDYFGEDPFKGYTFLQKFYQMMKDLPNIQKYIKDFRKPKNDDNYIAIAMRVLFS